MTENSRADDVVAGLSVFLAMSYVAFANPILMATAGKAGYGMSGVAVFFATCLVAAIATYVSGWYSGSPAALAPGLALSAVLSDYLVARDTTITWESALIDCGIAGAFLLILSRTGHRREIIDSIPSVIKKSIMAGIGSVLAKKAIDIVVGYPNPKGVKFAAAIFSIGLLIIVVGYFGMRLLAIKAAAKNKKTLDLLGRSSFIVSIIVLAVAVWLFDAGTLKQIPTGAWFAWSDSAMPLGDAVYGAIKPASWPLIVLVLYILIIDIIGSPYHLATLDRASYDSEPFPEAEERRIERSFVVDSGVNIIAPVFGSTPVVYYAENLTAKVLNAREAVVAHVVAGGFLALFIVGLALWINDIPLTYFVPQIAVTPVLFTVGLIIMSESLKSDKKAREKTPEEVAQAQSYSSAESELLELVPRIPAPLAIVLTPLVGFEIGIAAGILFYAIFQWMVPVSAPAPDKIHSSANQEKSVTLFLIAAALFSVGIRAWLFFTS